MCTGLKGSATEVCKFISGVKLIEQLVMLATLQKTNRAKWHLKEMQSGTLPKQKKTPSGNLPDKKKGAKWH